MSWKLKKKTYSREAVTYCGPTYVAITNANHSQSSALHNLHDMKHIHLLDEFSASFKNKGNDKPAMIVTVDDGPDKNTRYMRTMECAIDFFLTYDIDALLIATNTSGYSTKELVVPLNKEMAGLILDHKHFGTHLNSKGETIDKDLELINFEHAG